MIMSNADIIREYKAAKTPMKQIGILADQNLCKKRDIVEILVKEGCEVPKFYTKAKEKNGDPAQTAADINVGTKEPEPLQETATEVDERDSFVLDIDEVEPIGDFVTEPMPDLRISRSNDREQKLCDALKSIGDYGIEIRRNMKKIRSLNEGIKQLLKINTNIDLTSGGSEAIMQAVSAFAEEINVFLFVIENYMGDADKIVVNTTLPQEKTGDGE